MSNEANGETTADGETKDEVKGEAKGEAKKLEESPFYKVCDIPDPSDVKDRSTVSLHLLVKNGASCAGRLMENVGPYVDEVVAVLNDCDDETEEILRTACEKLGISFVPIVVTRESHPELYIFDEKATYEVGQSLSGEDFAGPFVNEPILAEWSATRNLGWRACTKDWRLFLDIDDVVLDPECIPGLVKLLEQHGVELACSSYHFSVDSAGRAMGSSFRERLARNLPRIVWARPIHETLTGTMRIAHVRGNLVVRDMRDNAGKGVRVPGRNFKVLYERARRKDWEVSPRLYADLIMEVRHMADAPGMMEFALALREKYLEEATWPEERAWVYAMVAEMQEGLGDIEGAIAGYLDSLEVHPGTKTAFRLCRARFKLACKLKDELEKFENDVPAKEGIVPGDLFIPNDFLVKHASMRVVLAAAWQAVIDVHDIGVDNKKAHQVLDDGPIYEEMEEIHVAGALIELGRIDEARARLRKAVEAFPEASALAVMAAVVEKMHPTAGEMETCEATPPSSHPWLGRGNCVELINHEPPHKNKDGATWQFVAMEQPKQ